MESKARRMTKQRKIILDLLRGTDHHPTADWIYAQTRKQLPKISLGTVYRNLNILSQEGAIIQLTDGKNVSRFDGNPEDHYHCICTECGRITDLKIPPLGFLEEQAAAQSGYAVFMHRIDFFGICQHCCVSAGDK